MPLRKAAFSASFANSTVTFRYFTQINERQRFIGMELTKIKFCNTYSSITRLNSELAIFLRNQYLNSVFFSFLPILIFKH